MHRCAGQAAPAGSLGFRVGHRVTIYLPSLDGGGPERAMLNVARGLTGRGFQVELAAASAVGHFLDIVPEHVRLVDLGCRRTLSSLLPLIRHLRRERPDVLISSLPHANVVALLANKFLRQPLPVVALRTSNFSLRHADANLKERAAMTLEKHLLPAAHAVVAVSKGVADDLKRVAPRAAHLVRVIHDPVVWRGHEEEAAAPVAHPWFGGSGPPVILAVGRLVALKGHAHLLRAVARVAAARPVRLVIVGEGPERGRLNKLAASLGISHLVDFPGFQLNPLPYMRQAQVFALSSTYEALPNALIQAMACGTPVVSTDCPTGPREILEDGKWGALTPVHDAEALATAILKTLDNPVAPSLLKASAARYAARTSIDGYANVMASILDTDAYKRNGAKTPTKQAAAHTAAHSAH